MIAITERYTHYPFYTAMIFDNGNINDCLKHSNYPWLAANLMIDGKPLFLDTWTKTVNGVKVGFFSVVTPEYPRISDNIPNDMVIEDIIKISNL